MPTEKPLPPSAIKLSLIWLQLHDPWAVTDHLTPQRWNTVSEWVSTRKRLEHGLPEFYKLIQLKKKKQRGESLGVSLRTDLQMHFAQLGLKRLEVMKLQQMQIITLRIAPSWVVSAFIQLSSAESEEVVRRAISQDE